MNVLIVVGTGRENRKTIDVAEAVRKSFVENGHETEMFDPKGKEIPFLGNRRYKDDEDPTPEPIEKFGKLVESTDLIVLVSPEYNHSVPGELKNLLDYLYPEYKNKPFSYVTVSAGGFGGVRALGHLQDITLGLGGHPGPSVPISRVSNHFTDGEPDEETEERLKDFVGKATEFGSRILE